MALLNPYLNFPGTTREAIDFYASVLGGEPTATTFAEAGMANDTLPADGILHAQLVTDLGFTLMASDANPATELHNGSISISGDEADAIRGYFEGLGAGGKVDEPLMKAPWGDEFGQVTDKYGVAWLFNISPKQA